MNTRFSEVMRILNLMVFMTGLFVTGCSREEGRGANSPDENTRVGQRGITNVNALGSPLGPLGATSVNPGTVITGTTADILINTTNGQPLRPPPPPAQDK